ncbi:hypothetical protein B9Z46_04090 [Limnohabitans sp. Hippo4]|nr:hypothetical protein B9Z46_04090 [Limnohabitans sp. Hippo4]
MLCIFQLLKNTGGHQRQQRPLLHHGPGHGRHPRDHVAGVGREFVLLTECFEFFARGRTDGGQDPSFLAQFFPCHFGLFGQAV